MLSWHPYLLLQHRMVHLTIHLMPQMSEMLLALMGSLMGKPTLSLLVQTLVLVWLVANTWNNLQS